MAVREKRSTGRLDSLNQYRLLFNHVWDSTRFQQASTSPPRRGRPRSDTTCSRPADTCTSTHCSRPPDFWRPAPPRQWARPWVRRRPTPRYEGRGCARSTRGLKEGTVCRRAAEESTRASLASQRSGIQRNTSSLSADRVKDHLPFAIHPPAMEHFHRMVTIHSVSLEKRVDSSESNAQTPWHSGTAAHACSPQRSVVLCMDVNVVDAEVAGDMRESTEDADGGWSGRKRRTETLS